MYTVRFIDRTLRAYESFIFATQENTLIRMMTRRFAHSMSFANHPQPTFSINTTGCVLTRTVDTVTRECLPTITVDLVNQRTNIPYHETFVVNENVIRTIARYIKRRVWTHV